MSPSTPATGPIPMLVVVSGPPGTGKTTIADAIADATGIPVFNKDQIEASLWRSGITADHDSWQVAEDLLGTLAHQQLMRARSAVLDTVAGRNTSRNRWHSITQECDGAFKPIECMCSDQRLHRSRIEGRVRGIPGWYELTWDDVQRSSSRYEPWERDRLVLDAVDPLNTNITAALRYLET